MTATTPGNETFSREELLADADRCERFASMGDTDAPSALRWKMRARALRLAALSQAASPGGEWQTMETAPKDGTYVLLTRGQYIPLIGAWQTHEGMSRWGEDPETFMEEAHFLEYWGAVSYQPTHWMPLPKPPEETL